MKLITVEEICYFQADNKYTRGRHAARGVADPQDRSRSSSEELDPALFWQIHRSTLVNVNAIESVARNAVRARVGEARSSAPNRCP